MVVPMRIFKQRKLPGDGHVLLKCFLMREGYIENVLFSSLRDADGDKKCSRHLFDHSGSHTNSNSIIKQTKKTSV